MSFWWCLDHKRVEEGLGCGSTTRVGPYDTPERAATAIQRTRERGAEQDAKDAGGGKWGKK
jgi:hypothetical protein